jgi:hypothetical protein
MQLAQAILENHQKLVVINASSQVGGIAGFLTRVFGCRHKEMSRPLSVQGQTYRTCLHCGARRQFNLKSWEMEGDYYYGLPANKGLSAKGAKGNSLAPQPRCSAGDPALGHRPRSNQLRLLSAESAK